MRELTTDMQLMIRACKDRLGGGKNVIRRLRRIYSLQRYCSPGPHLDIYIIEMLILAKQWGTRGNDSIKWLELISDSTPENVWKVGGTCKGWQPDTELTHTERIMLALVSQVRLTAVDEWPDYHEPAMWRHRKAQEAMEKQAEGRFYREGKA